MMMRKEVGEEENGLFAGGKETQQEEKSAGTEMHRQSLAWSRADPGLQLER